MGKYIYYKITKFYLISKNYYWKINSINNLFRENKIPLEIAVDIKNKLQGICENADIEIWSLVT